MNRAHYLKTDIRRLIKNYPIYLAIVGVAVSMWFSLEDYAFTEGMVNGNALDTYGFAVSMSGIMIAYAFCAFSYATVFCEDLEYKYARYSINRGNTWKYVVSKAVVVYGASVITMVLGSLLFVASIRLKMQHVNMYHAIRVGRKCWALGQIGGIFIRSVVLTVVAVICTILPLLPDIEWSNEWGKLLRTAATTRALTQFDSSVFIYYEIFSEFSPLQLIGLEILLCACICTFIGVLMFLLSLFLNKIAAVAGGLALAIALFPVLNIHPMIRHKLAFFIPTIWAELARIATPDYGYYWLPSIPYMFGFLIAGILCMTVIILIKVKKIEFNWENEDI